MDICRSFCINKRKKLLSPERWRLEYRLDGRGVNDVLDDRTFGMCQSNASNISLAEQGEGSSSSGAMVFCNVRALTHRFLFQPFP